MPCLIISSRLVLFPREAVDAWIESKFLVSRGGKASR